MKRWRLHQTPDTLSTRVVRSVLAGIGTPALAAQFMHAMHPQVPMTFCTVYVIGGDGRIEAVSAASQYGQTAEHTVARYIAERFDLKDPHMVWLSQRPRPRKSPQFWLGHHQADELADVAFRAACYGDVGIRERLSMLWLHTTGQRAAVNLYRSFAQPLFSPADFAQLEAHAALLADATSAHVRHRPPLPDAAQAGRAHLLLALSVREREAIRLLRTGLTAAAAAERMGLALSTFRTHQYRAFRRLQLRSIRELLVALPAEARPGA